MSTQKKIALGLSGGVDSAVSAALLQRAGFEVTAVFLECWREPGCRTDQDRKDALEVALQLDLPFQILDFKTAYKEKVVQYFYDEYQAGRTPNPDVICNREIKFGLFYDWAMENGFDAVATGHYAQVRNLVKKSNEAGDTVGQPVEDLALVTSADAHKDQTYFLTQIRAEQLPHIMFPVGHLVKEEVRRLAAELHLPVAAKKDSTGICFIGEINVHDLLKEKLGTNSGEVIDKAGNVIGTHDGLWFYTIGQRHGFALDTKALKTSAIGQGDPTNPSALYVIAKHPDTNQLVVGLKEDTECSAFTIRDAHWIGVEPGGQPLFVRIRHTGALHAARLTPHDSTCLIETDEPLNGVAEGQIATIYQPISNTSIYRCLGGGVITTP